MSDTECRNPLTAEVLEDYWLAEVEEAEEGRIEEHLLGCEQCSAALREVAEVAGGIREPARSGVLRMAVSGEFLERLARDGAPVQEYRVEAGGSVACTVTPDDVVMVGRLAADLAGVERLDLSLCDAEGREKERHEGTAAGGGEGRRADGGGVHVPAHAVGGIEPFRRS